MSHRRIAPIRTRQNSVANAANLLQGTLLSRSACKPTPQAWRVAAPVRWNYSRLLHVSRVQTLVVTPTNIARYKHHLRDWKRDGADARRARQPAGMVPARLRQAQPKRTWVYRKRK